MTSMATELYFSAVNIEDAGVANKKVTIDIPAEVVDSRLREQMDALTTQASLPGFRPGKVPKGLLEKRFGKGVREETRNGLVRDACSKAIRENNLKVLGNAMVKEIETLEVAPGKGLKFAFEVEVMPEFTLPPLEGVEIKRPNQPVTTEMIDKEINLQRERRGQLQPVEGPAQKGDFFIGRIWATNSEGKEVAALQQGVTRWPLEDDGSGAIGGIRVENLAKHLDGKNKSDVIEIELTGPANHEIEEIRGQKITVRQNVEHIGRLQPASMEEILASAGMASEEDLRKRLETALGEVIEGEKREVMRRQVIRYLMEKTEVPLPERASAAQAQRALEGMRLRLLQRGVPDYAIEKNLAEMRDASAERGKRELKIFFILERIAEQYGVTVNEQELNGRIFQIARARGMRPDKVRAELVESSQLAPLALQIRHEKAADHVVSLGKISDITAEEWNETMKKEGLAKDESED